MKLYDFIFSHEPAHRFSRHIAFWLAVFLYHFVRISFLFPSGHFQENIPYIVVGALLWGVICNVFFSYSIVYFLVPKFFTKKKYKSFAIGMLLMLIVSYAVFSLATIANSQMTNAAVGKNVFQYPLVFLKAVLIRFLGNPPLICGTLLALKKMKDWYLKQHENRELERENGNAELQLLKAQVHPHFLFNTLNNIYFFILSDPAKATKLVGKLENLLHYMINECNVPEVLLGKELDMIKDYLDLEKVRYEKLDIELKITGSSTNKMIAPLLMIPFIENSFKHGTSKMLKDPWIKLFLQIDTDMLHFTLANNKPAGTESIQRNGIGLNNVKKRLALLHPANHYLAIEPTPNSFTVNMQIPLT